MLSNFKRIEIELQNICNRKCNWCPNKEFDRIYEEMPEGTFLKIIKELRENNFQYRDVKSAVNYVSFNRFCEPMFNVGLLKKRVQQAFEIAPEFQYLVNTNGDFLTPENLNGLFLDRLNIMDYDCKGMEYWLERFADLKIVVIERDDVNESIVGIHKSIGKVNCEVNWPKKAKLENRAGYFDGDVCYKDSHGIEHSMSWRNDRARRYINCLEPAYYSSIDWNGNVMLCCHHRSDNPDHKSMILGNVNEQSLVEILFGEKAERFKEILGSDRYDEYPESCKHCQKLRGRQIWVDQSVHRSVYEAEKRRNGDA